MRKLLRLLWDECVDFTRFLGQLYMLFCGDLLLFGGASYGLYLFCGQDTYIHLFGAWEEFFGMALGAAILLGSCGSMALRYGKRKIFGKFRFRLQVMVRVAFLLIGPLATAMKWSFFVENAGIWTLAALPCLTIIPFGLSLRSLILKQRKSHS